MAGAYALAALVALLVVVVVALARGRRAAGFGGQAPSSQSGLEWGPVWGARTDWSVIMQNVTPDRKARRARLEATGMPAQCKRVGDSVESQCLDQRHSLAAINECIGRTHNAVLDCWRKKECAQYSGDARRLCGEDVAYEQIKQIMYGRPEERGR